VLWSFPRAENSRIDGLMSSIYDMEEDTAEDSSSCLVALKFPDDFAEFQARADSGGSAYGVLKRHGFAQQSLRVVAPSDPEVDVVVPQRRANSLVPPAVSMPYTEASGDDSAVADQKMIIAVLCDQSPQQQRRHRYHHHHHHHHHSQRDLTISDDDDTDRPQYQRQRSRSLQYLYVVTDEDYCYHHHHKHQRHQPSNQQHLQQPKQPAIKMDTLQV